jgi:hypothetical protein
MSFLVTREAVYDIFTDTIDEDLRTWKITFALYIYRWIIQYKINPLECDTM